MSTFASTSMAHYLTETVRMHLGPDSTTEHAARICLTQLQAMFVAFAEKDDDTSAIMALGCSAMARQVSRLYFPPGEEEEIGPVQVPDQ